MATARGRDDATVEDRLRADPGSFEFVAAVRALAALYHERALCDPRWRREPVGHDDTRFPEVVRFRADPSLCFAPGEIAALEQPRPAGEVDEPRLPPPELTLSFLGLIGPAAALPDHYTATVISRLRSRDRAMRDFLDIFHHRAASLFHRAATKYRLAPEFEAAARVREREERAVPGTRSGHLDRLTASVYALVGLGTDGLRGRQHVPDDAYLFYAGAFATHRPNAVTLERMVAEYFELPAQVVQFQGEWLHLGRGGRTVLPATTDARGRNNALGVDTGLGQQAWVVESKIRVRLGPMDLASFETFLPGATALAALGDFVRTYVGTEVAFDVVPILAAESIPECALDSFSSHPLRLGANVWLRSVAGEADFAGAAFSPPELGSPVPSR